MVGNESNQNPTSTDSRSLRVVISYKLKYVQEVLVNLIGKLAQEKSGLVN